MAVTHDPIFTQTVRNIAAKATAAKTTMTDSANAVLLDTAGANGSEYSHISARANGTFTDTVLYLFTSSDAGTTLHQKAAIKVTGATISTTAAPAENSFGFTKDSPLKLTAGERLYCAASVVLSAGWEFEGTVEDY
jgi:hypothetical protein